MSTEDKRPTHESDHDLLIRIDTKLGLLIEQFHTHKEATLKELSVLSEQKINKTDVLAMKTAADKIHDDYEIRLRRIERFGSIAIGGLIVVQALLGIEIF